MANRARIYSKQAKSRFPGFGGIKEERAALATYEARAREKEIEALQEEAEVYAEELNKIKEFIAEASQRIGVDLRKEAEGVAAEATVVGAAGGAMMQELATADIATATKMIAGLIKGEKDLKKRIEALNKRLEKLGATPIKVPGLVGFGMRMPRVSGKTIKWILIAIAVIIVVIYLIFLFTSTTGAYASSEAGGITAPIMNAWRGFASPLNQFKMIMTGEYDPSEIWTSKTYEDRYTVVEDVGVELEEIKPLRDTFTEGDPVLVVGRLKAVSLPEDPEGVTVDISAKGKPSVFGIFKCVPSSIEGTRRFLGRFECKSSSSTIILEQESHNVDVSLDYNFDVKAGKQTYVATNTELNRLFIEDIDPMKYYEISADEVRSWQTRSPVGLGIGILGIEEGIIAANNPDNPSPYHLGITIKNDGTGKIPADSVIKLTLEVPAPPDIEFRKAESDFPEPSIISIDGLKIAKYVKAARLTEDLEPGEYETFFFVFKVNEDEFLQGAPLASFFALASLEYEYSAIKTVPVKIKGAPAPEKASP